MNTFYLIRHAETEYNANWGQLVWWRSNHLKLTQKWEKQAHLLWKYLHDNNYTFDKIYSSIAVRALTTSQIVCEYIQKVDDIIESDRILELAQWDWEWKPRNEIYTREVFEQIKADNWNFKAPNWESQREVEERMLEFLRENISNKNEKIAIFTHWMAIKCLLRWVFDSSATMTNKINIDNTSITKLTFNEKWWNVDYINFVPHL